MNEEDESMKRVLLHIKGAARGFKRDRLASRLKPSPVEMPPEGTDQLDQEPDPLDPNEPAEIAAGEPPAEDPANADAAAKLDAIRKLIGSV